MWWYIYDFEHLEPGQQLNIYDNIRYKKETADGFFVLTALSGNDCLIGEFA